MQPGRAARASPMSILHITSRRFRDQLRSGDRVEDKVKIRRFRLVALAAALTAGCNGSEPVVPGDEPELGLEFIATEFEFPDRKSTRLNSSHGYISYAVFCL